MGFAFIWWLLTISIESDIMSHYLKCPRFLVSTYVFRITEYPNLSKSTYIYNGNKAAIFFGIRPHNGRVKNGQTNKMQIFANNILRFKICSIHYQPTTHSQLDCCITFIEEKTSDLILFSSLFYAFLRPLHQFTLLTSTLSFTSEVSSDCKYWKSYGPGPPVQCLESKAPSLTLTLNLSTSSILATPLFPAATHVWKNEGATLETIDE